MVIVLVFLWDVFHVLSLARYDDQYTRRVYVMNYLFIIAELADQRAGHHGSWVGGAGLRAAARPRPWPPEGDAAEPYLRQGGGQAQDSRGRRLSREALAERTSDMFL